MLDSDRREKRQRHRETKTERDRQETHRHTTERWRGSHELCPWFCCCRETGRAASQPSQRGKEGWGSCQGLFCSNRPLEHQPGPLPHTPTRYGLHAWAWASLGTISGPFFLEMLSP